MFDANIAGDSLRYFGGAESIMGMVRSVIPLNYLNRDLCCMFGGDAESDSSNQLTKYSPDLVTSSRVFCC